MVTKVRSHKKGGCGFETTPSLLSKIRDLSDHKYVHYDKMTNTSSHDEEVKDLVRTKILMSAIENREFQCVNDSADRVDDTSCQQPHKCSSRKCL